MGVPSGQERSCTKHKDVLKYYCMQCDEACCGDSIALHGFVQYDISSLLMTSTLAMSSKSLWTFRKSLLGVSSFFEMNCVLPKSIHLALSPIFLPIASARYHCRLF